MSHENLPNIIQSKPWKFYPGNSKIFCKGKFITSKNYYAFLVANILIIIGTFSFIFFE